MGKGSSNLPNLVRESINAYLGLLACDGVAIYLCFAGGVQPSPSLKHVSPISSNDGDSGPPMTDATRNAHQMVSWASVSRRLFAVEAQTSVLSPTHLSSTSLPFKKCIERRVVVRTGTLKWQPVAGYLVENSMVAPLFSLRGEYLGLVHFFNKKKDFSVRDSKLVAVIAGQLSLLIENGRLIEHQDKLLEGFVNACMTAIEARDPITFGHSHRVADYSVALSQAVNRSTVPALKGLQFTDSQLKEIRFAAILHDVGKMSVKESILNKEKKLFPYQLDVIHMRMRLMRANFLLIEIKTGVTQQAQIKRLDQAWELVREANEPAVMPSTVNRALDELRSLQVIDDQGVSLHALTEDEKFRLSISKGSLTRDERIEVQKHVSMTYEILRMIPWSNGLERVPEIAHKHHEKLDGSGYPSKVCAPEIPVQSRILTICDIYDALTAEDRPYKTDLPIDQALAILQQEVEEHKLDADLFQVFVDSRIFDLTRKLRIRRAA